MKMNPFTNTIVPFFEETIRNNKIVFPRTCLLLSIIKDYSDKEITDMENWNKLTEYLVLAFNEEALTSGLYSYYCFVIQDEGDPAMIRLWKYTDNY